MSRYYNADQSVYELLNKLIEERFRSTLSTATIRILIDTKPQIDKLTNKIIFASIKRPTEVEKFLAHDGYNLDGLDYIIFLSELVWDIASDKDKKRILSHELRHTFLDEKGNYKIIKHDIEDFYEEIKLNEDDPMWAQSLSTIAVAKYEQLKEEQKTN